MKNSFFVNSTSLPSIRMTLRFISIIAPFHSSTSGASSPYAYVRLRSAWNFRKQHIRMKWLLNVIIRSHIHRHYHIHRMIA